VPDIFSSAQALDILRKPDTVHKSADTVVTARLLRSFHWNSRRGEQKDAQHLLLFGTSAITASLSGPAMAETTQEQYVQLAAIEIA
jgi:hypothetical protein